MLRRITTSARNASLVVAWYRGAGPVLRAVVVLFVICVSSALGALVELAGFQSVAPMVASPLLWLLGLSSLLRMAAVAFDLVCRVAQ
jgi:hypothetical protein